jgi:hypothetical protein
MRIRYLLFACALAICGYLLYQSGFALLEVPSIGEFASDTQSDKTDEIAFKMKFGGKTQGVLDMLVYTLKDESFVVSDNSRICPQQDCQFQFKDADLA